MVILLTLIRPYIRSYLGFKSILTELYGLELSEKKSVANDWQFFIFEKNINFDVKSGKKSILAIFEFFLLVLGETQIRIKLKIVLKKIDDFMAKNAFCRFYRFFFFS